MSKRYLQSRDDVAIFLSLATALGILLSTIVVMWIWTSVNGKAGLPIS
ncbi:MAG: hypothetical protein JSR29_18650 [Nitrospira sp.]|nr:hypothetical protein [Nitrospira sp.]